MQQFACMDIINNWLNGKRNYYVGVAIYNTFGHDAGLKKLFATKSAYAEQKLVEALQGLVQKVVTVPQTPKPTPSMPDTADPVLIAIKNEWMPLYVAMNFKRQQLHNYRHIHPCSCKNYPDCGHQLSTKEKELNELYKKTRKTLAFEILDLEQQCQNCWDKRDYYLTHKVLPNQEAKPKFEKPTDPLELGRAVEACKKNIRRNRKKMKDIADNAEYAALYQYWKDYYQFLTGKAYAEKN